MALEKNPAIAKKSLKRCVIMLHPVWRLLVFLVFFFAPALQLFTDNSSAVFGKDAVCEFSELKKHLAAFRNTRPLYTGFTDEGISLITDSNIIELGLRGEVTEHTVSLLSNSGLPPAPGIPPVPIRDSMYVWPQKNNTALAVVNLRTVVKKHVIQFETQFTNLCRISDSAVAVLFEDNLVFIDIHEKPEIVSRIQVRGVNYTAMHAAGGGAVAVYNFLQHAIEFISPSGHVYNRVRIDATPGVDVPFAMQLGGNQLCMLSLPGSTKLYRLQNAGRTKLKAFASFDAPGGYSSALKPDGTAIIILDYETERLTYYTRFSESGRKPFPGNSVFSEDAGRQCFAFFGQAVCDKAARLISANRHDKAYNLALYGLTLYDKTECRALQPVIRQLARLRNDLRSVLEPDFPYDISVSLIDNEASGLWVNMIITKSKYDPGIMPSEFNVTLIFLENGAVVSESVVSARDGVAAGFSLPEGIADIGSSEFQLILLIRNEPGELLQYYRKTL